MVEDTRPDVFVYAGDLSPRRDKYNTPELQYEFVRRNFMERVALLRVPLKFVMPGNTDFITGIERFKQEYTDPAVVKFVVNESVVVQNKQLCFLSTVSYTDHALKDTEAFNEFEDQNTPSFVKRSNVEHVFTRSC